MFHPCSVIANDINMLQAGQHFDFSEDLERDKIIQLTFYMYFNTRNENETLITHLHAVVLGDFFDKNFLHSIILAIQLVHNLQEGNRDNKIVLINPCSSMEEFVKIARSRAE